MAQDQLADPGRESPGSEQQPGHCEAGPSVCLGVRSCPLKEKFSESLGAGAKSRKIFFPSWRSEGLPGEVGVIKAVQRNLGQNEETGGLSEVQTRTGENDGGLA